MSLKFIAKVIIEGKITLKTGMCIGTDQNSVAIGEVDNNVIKTFDGIPYIPGSSLKGKLRSLLEKYCNDFRTTFDGRDNENQCNKSMAIAIGTIFGTVADKNTAGPTRLIVRDSFWSDSANNRLITDKLESEYTEVKMENSIDRKTSKAKNPRPTERVPAGAEFDFCLNYSVLNVQDIDNMKLISQSFELLEDDYLGGSGTRGYGQVEITPKSIHIKQLKDYEEGKNGIEIDTVQKTMEKLKEVTKESGVSTSNANN